MFSTCFLQPRPVQCILRGLVFSFLLTSLSVWLYFGHRFILKEAEIRHGKSRLCSSRREAFEPRAHALDRGCSIVVTAVRSQNQRWSISSGFLTHHCCSPEESWPPGNASSVVCTWPPRDWEVKLQRCAVVFPFCHSRLAMVLEWDVCALRCRS